MNAHMGLMTTLQSRRALDTNTNLMMMPTGLPRVLTLTTMAPKLVFGEGDPCEELEERNGEGPEEPAGKGLGRIRQGTP